MSKNPDDHRSSKPAAHHNNRPRLLQNIESRLDYVTNKTTNPWDAAVKPWQGLKPSESTPKGEADSELEKTRVFEFVATESPSRLAQASDLKTQKPPRSIFDASYAPPGHKAKPPKPTFALYMAESLDREPINRTSQSIYPNPKVVNPQPSAFMKDPTRSDDQQAEANRDVLLENEARRRMSQEHDRGRRIRKNDDEMSESEEELELDNVEPSRTKLPSQATISTSLLDTRRSSAISETSSSSSSKTRPRPPRDPLGRVQALPGVWAHPAPPREKQKPPKPTFARAMEESMRSTNPRHDLPMEEVPEAVALSPTLGLSQEAFERLRDRQGWGNTTMEEREEWRAMHGSGPNDDSMPGGEAEE